MKLRRMSLLASGLPSQAQLGRSYETETQISPCESHKYAREISGSELLEMWGGPRRGRKRSSKLSEQCHGLKRQNKTKKPHEENMRNYLESF